MAPPPGMSVLISSQSSFQVPAPCLFPRHGKCADRRSASQPNSTRRSARKQISKASYVSNTMCSMSLVHDSWRLFISNSMKQLFHRLYHRPSKKHIVANASNSGSAWMKWKKPMTHPGSAFSALQIPLRSCASNEPFFSNNWQSEPVPMSKTRKAAQAHHLP